MKPVGNTRSPQSASTPDQAARSLIRIVTTETDTPILFAAQELERGLATEGDTHPLFDVFLFLRTMRFKYRIPQFTAIEDV